jgi:LDH2 family malate/lactate/ureidoglycolate dehydrogenase
VSTVTIERLQAFIHAAMVKLGLPDRDAAVVAALMAQADLQGSDGHGVSRLPQYARRIKAGGFNTRPDIRVVREQASTALVNGDNGMGHLVMNRAAGIAIEKARATGIGWVNAQFSNHAGPASLYARMPLAHDMIGSISRSATPIICRPGAGSTCCCRPTRSRPRSRRARSSRSCSTWPRRLRPTVRSRPRRCAARPCRWAG